MRDFSKYQGVIPAFYACYDDNGEISPERVRALTRYFIGKGVQGLYAVSYTHLTLPTKRIV